MGCPILDNLSLAYAALSIAGLSPVWTISLPVSPHFKVVPPFFSFSHTVFQTFFLQKCFQTVPLIAHDYNSDIAMPPKIRHELPPLWVEQVESVNADLRYINTQSKSFRSGYTPFAICRRSIEIDAHISIIVQMDA